MHIRLFDTFGEMRSEVAALLRAELARPSDGPAALMLPGGRTPLPVYEEIARDPVGVSGDVHVFLSDERHVPVDSPESNYGGLLPLLRALQLPESRVLRVDTALPLDEAATGYHRQIASFIDGGGVIRLGLLGVGADGHTASLFTPDDLERGRGRYAVATRREAGPDRVSVTPDLLAGMARLVFIAAGPEKREIVEKIGERPDGVVAARAVAGARNVELWFADEGA